MAIVQRILFPDDRQTGPSSHVLPLDVLVKTLQEVVIQVNTPYFTGEETVGRMDNLFMVS